MKRVVIVRHAKSVPYGYEDDFNRNLTERGEEDAAKIISKLQQCGIKADVMISSPAKRALETAHIFAQSLVFDKKEIIEVKDLYDGMTTSQFIKLINDLPESAESAFFFGHNPDLNNFADNLLRDFGRDMPTCSTLVINFDVTRWKDVGARKGEIGFHFIPQMFR